MRLMHIEGWEPAPKGVRAVPACGLQPGMVIRLQPDEDVEVVEVRQATPIEGNTAVFDGEFWWHFRAAARVQVVSYPSDWEERHRPPEVSDAARRRMNREVRERK